MRITKQAVVVFLVSTAIWFVAGYLSGYTKGKGWRDAIIEAGCVIKCPMGELNTTNTLLVGERGAR